MRFAARYGVDEIKCAPLDKDHSLTLAKDGTYIDACLEGLKTTHSGYFSAAVESTQSIELLLSFPLNTFPSRSYYSTGKGLNFFLTER